MRCSHCRSQVVLPVVLARAELQLRLGLRLGRLLSTCQHYVATSRLTSIINTVPQSNAQLVWHGHQGDPDKILSGVGKVSPREVSIATV
jgi:hypothetical protein